MSRLVVVDATFRFFLERVQNVNRFGKTNGVHGSPGVAAMMCNDLDDGASAKATHGFRCRIDFTILRCLESSADAAAHLARKFAHLCSTRAAHSTGPPQSYVYTAAAYLNR